MEVNETSAEFKHDVRNIQLRVESMLDLLKTSQIKLDEEVIGDLIATLIDLEKFLVSTGVKQ